MRRHTSRGTGESRNAHAARRHGECGEVESLGRLADRQELATRRRRIRTIAAVSERRRRVAEEPPRVGIGDRGNRCVRQRERAEHRPHRDSRLVSAAAHVAPRRMGGSAVHRTGTVIDAVRARADHVRVGCRTAREREDRGSHDDRHVSEQPRDGNRDEEHPAVQHRAGQLMPGQERRQGTKPAPHSVQPRIQRSRRVRNDTISATRWRPPRHTSTYR